MKEKESCEKLIKRWNEIQRKIPKLQNLSPREKVLNLTYLIPEEKNELNDIEKKLEKECREYVSSIKSFQLKKPYINI